MNFNARTHAIALALLGSATVAAGWYLRHQDQIAAVAHYILNHPTASTVGGFGGLLALILPALYNPSK